MKKNKLAEIIIILTIILVTLISFVGIYVQNQSNMENIVNEFSYSEELGGYIEIIFETKDEVSEEKMAVSMEIMKKRLEDIELEEYDIHQNPENGNILLRLSKNEDIEYITNTLYPQGKFEIIDSESKEVLMDSSYIENSYTIYNNVTNGTAIYMTIEFNEEGTNKLKEITQEYVASKEKETDENEEDAEAEHEEAKQISLTLDGNTLITTSFTEPITDGMIYVTVGNPTRDQDTLLMYVEESTRIASTIKNGTMPLSYSVSSNTYITSNIMKEDLMNVVLGVAIVTILALAILIIKYKKMGLLTSMSYIGFVATFTLLIRYTDSSITFNSICGIIIALILNFILTVKLAKNIESKDNLANVKEKFKKCIKEFIMLLIPIAIVTIVTAFVNSAAIRSLGIVLFWGIFVILTYNFIITKNLLEARTKK